MIHRKKNRPALHRRDILTISLASFYFFKIFFYSKFAELFFHPILSGSVLFSILHSSVLFKTLLFRAFLSHLPPSSFLQGLSSEQFAELESVHLLAFSDRACSMAFLSLWVSFLAICRAVLIYVVIISGLF